MKVQTAKGQKQQQPKGKIHPKSNIFIAKQSGYIREQDYEDEDFFDLENEYDDKKYMQDPTAMNSNANSVNQSVLDESMQQTINALVGKAYELSMKYDLRDEAQIIQQEQNRLNRLLQDEEDERNEIVTRLNDEEARLKNAFKDNKSRSRQAMPVNSKTMGAAMNGTKFNNQFSQSTLQSQYNHNNKSQLSQKQKIAKPSESMIYPQSMLMSSVQNTKDNINTLFNESNDQLNESEMILLQAAQRLHNDAIRRKELKERIQLLSAKRELEELRQQPQINQKSNKLVNKKEKNYVPIHERYEKVLHEASIKKNQYTAEILEESIQKDPDQYFPSFHPRTNEGRGHGDFNRFIENTQKWQVDKQQKLENVNLMTLNNLDQKCTFRPEINKSTSDIILNSEKYKTATEFLERVEKYQEIKEMKIKHLENALNKDVTFKPNTYSKYDVASKYYERQIKKQQQMQSNAESQRQSEAKLNSKGNSQKSSEKTLKKNLSKPDPNIQKQFQSMTERNMTPTFNLSVVESQRFGVHNDDFDEYGQGHHSQRQDIKGIASNYRSDDKLTQITNTNEKVQSHFSVNEDSFAGPSNQWIFSSEHHVGGGGLQSSDDEDQDFAPSQQISNFNQKPSRNQGNSKTIDMSREQQQKQQNQNRGKIDLQDYLAQLEIKMKQDEEELQVYERQISKHNSSNYDQY